MRSRIVPVLALCALVTSPSVGRGQSGPDNDPDGAPGYVNSVFHHGQVDSVNMYNGQLTVPISLGPSYPVGPKLRVQVVLTYNSRSVDYGAPTTQSPEFFYRPLVGNPSLGSGWELTPGAIKNCKHGAITGVCYFAADGSQHMFATGPKASDASPLYLSPTGSTGPYDMWDGDGNHYFFNNHVSGYDDVGLPEGYTHDFGRGRDGWYLSSVTDPYGNSYSIGYYSTAEVTTPRWTYVQGTFPCANPTLFEMRTPAGTGTWIPKDITLPSGSRIHFATRTVMGVSGMIGSVDFPEFVDGASTTKTWTLDYEATPAALGHSCGLDASQHATTIVANVPRLKSLTLPADDSGSSPAYLFSSSSELSHVLLDRITLPTGGSIQYCYNAYTFFHGRGGKLQPGCPGIIPPADDPDNVVTESDACSLAVDEEAAPEIPGGCTSTNPERWIDTQPGVVRRREIVGAAQNDTTYRQFAFPFGETGNAASPENSQTLTIAIFPGTDANGDSGRSRARAVLFRSTRGPSSPTGELPSLPGDVVGAEVEERIFETDPTLTPLQDPPCGGAIESGFCGSKAVRVVQKTHATDSPAEGLAGTNRRLIAEKTIYGASTCGGCPWHEVDFGPTTDNVWDDNGRHYPVETHTGTLGNDGRTVTTYWAPWNWDAGPPAGQPVLPNLFTRRTTTAGASSKDEYFEFDTTTAGKYGFLRGTFVYDPATYGSPGNTFSTIVFLTCRYDDGAGNVDKEFTATYPGVGSVPDNPCSTVYPTFPNPLPGNGDAFGKDYTWQHGELLSARWINGTSGTATFPFRDDTRDATTGWITGSKDTSGRQTSYQYDALGRVHRITPPSASELATFVCYEGPGATTAYRASARQACPVASSNAGVATWQHFEFDGLARLAREKRLQPSSAVVKRFHLYDGAGNAYFTSEWVPDATSQSITPDLSTTCAFGGGTYTGRARPSAAPGTYRLCYDPFGRPQQIVGPKMSSLVVVDRTDGPGNVYSDTKEAALTYCVNAAFSNLTTPTCSAGGINATTTTKKDADGRIVSVTEPSGDVTTHTYDINGRLLTVTQGTQQSRTFVYDDNGFLRKETTPERGTVYYDSIGSLGDVLSEKQPDGLVVSRTFDFAGRLAEEDAPPGTRYVVNCYDGAATCIDGSAGYSGGSYPGGKLTRRYGYNWIPTVGPVVDEQFTYGDGGGRLSQLTTAVGNGDLSAATAQSWTYNNLGLVGTHNNPRVSGSFPVATTYSNGLPTAISANSFSLVTAATYNPAAGLASWTSNTSPTAVVTTIAQDASMLPRPSQIKTTKGSSSLFDTGTYAYDGAGNVLSESDPNDGGSFTYDNRSRILSSVYGVGSRSFGYDRWGNLLQNGSLSYPVDGAHNRLIIGGSTSAVSYDGRGNLTLHNADAMSYDSLDRLYRNQSGSSDFVFLHNGAGERIVKFPGNSSLARREMARLVGEANKAAGKTGWTSAPDACLGTFSDVPCSDADAGWIQTLYDHGTAAGCGGSQFCPDPPGGTLNRAQMAVFIVKGYRADGAPVPACTGIFADVPCSGGSPWVPFAPYIEQLSRDNVTAGCGGGNFCPGNSVTPWQILVWMSKTPPVPGSGKTWASVYHPVPRGSIYTLRDEQNRVVTEMTDASSGSASATLSVQRDNVFFGNLLVASNSAGTWNYDVSDHLGSVRKVWSMTGSLTESHKYWPYGEDTNTGPPSQHLSFQTMERNDGVAQHFDHARTQHYSLGRFLSTDTASGLASIPQSWNRYAYARNNPNKMIDPNGLWPTEVHNRIIDLAFHGLSEHQRLVLKAASVSMDACPACQMRSHSHDHFMKSPGEDPQAARHAAESLIQKEEGAAQRMQGPVSSAADIGDDSLKHFGMALHTVTDGTSPGHVDAGGAPRDWDGLPISPSRADAVREHGREESHPTADQLREAVRAAQQAFCETYGDAACRQAIRARQID